MTQQYSPQGFRMLPNGVKHLLIINILLYLATIVINNQLHFDLNNYLALYFMGSDMFRPWQYVTYMFMHGSLEHIFFNMFALWMFGYILENYWGTKRFLIFYFVCGIGAGLVHSLTIWLTSAPILTAINDFATSPSPDALISLYNEHFDKVINPGWITEVSNNWRADLQNPDYGMYVTDKLMEVYNTRIIGIPTVGASGAIYGILLAFGMMFPNERIYLYFLVPIKAKWFVILYAVIELVTGIAGTNDGVAHFAHLGGMIFGFLLILHWRHKANNSRWSNNI